MLLMPAEPVIIAPHHRTHRHPDSQAVHSLEPERGNAAELAVRGHLLSAAFADGTGFAGAADAFAVGAATPACNDSMCCAASTSF